MIGTERDPVREWGREREGEGEKGEKRHIINIGVAAIIEHRVMNLHLKYLFSHSSGHEVLWEQLLH